MNLAFCGSIMSNQTTSNVCSIGPYKQSNVNPIRTHARTYAKIEEPAKNKNNGATTGIFLNLVASERSC